MITVDTDAEKICMSHLIIAMHIYWEPCSFGYKTGVSPLYNDYK